MSACVSAREAIQLCQERVYRVVVIDMVIPDINSVALMNQLRALQPHAVMVALALRSANDTSAEVKANGFSDLLSKPFDGGAIDEFLGRHFEVDEVLVVDGNVLTCGKFEGKEEKIERYFSRVRTLARESLEKLASACHDEALIDLSMAPVRNDRLIHLVMLVDKECKRLGLGLRIIGTPDIKRALASVTDTADIPFFETRSAATEAA
jgi:PleD family two-component response regulator